VGGRGWQWAAVGGWSRWGRCKQSTATTSSRDKAEEPQSTNHQKEQEKYCA